MKKIFCILALLSLFGQIVGQEKEKKYEAIVLLDKNGAAHAGHAALLLGSEETGYLLYSKSKNEDEWISKGEVYSSINELNYKLTRYTDAFKVEITKDEFKKMNMGASLSINKEYSLYGINASGSPYIKSIPLVPDNKLITIDKSSNCMSVVTDAFQYADKPVGNMERFPNNSFQSLKEANNAIPIDISTITVNQSTEGGHKLITHIKHRIIVDDSMPIGNYKQTYISDEWCIFLNIEDLSKINSEFLLSEFKQVGGVYKFETQKKELKTRDEVVPNKKREERGL